MKTPTTITATELKHQSGQILRRVHQEGAHYVVERAGYQVVAIIPIAEYQKLMSTRAEPGKNDV